MCSVVKLDCSKKGKGYELDINPRISVEGADRNAHFQVFLCRRYICYLRVWHPISLILGDDKDPPLWDIDRFEHILNYWEPLKV